MTYVFWQVDDDNFNVVNLENVRRIGIGQGLKGPVIVFFFTEYQAITYKLPETLTRDEVATLLLRLHSRPVVDLDNLVKEILRRRKKEENKKVMKDEQRE